MVHVLYEGDVFAEEKVVEDLEPTSAYRVKTKTGRYAHLLATSEREAQAWADAH